MNLIFLRKIIQNNNYLTYITIVSGPMAGDCLEIVYIDQIR